jgi:hypothetical protein
MKFQSSLILLNVFIKDLLKHISASGAKLEGGMGVCGTPLPQIIPIGRAIKDFK